MLDQSTQQLVDDIVQRRTSAGELFTAFDITTEVRQRGKQVRHGEVRDHVHDLFRGGGMGASYERSVVDIDGNKPWVYHRFDVNPKSYGAKDDGSGDSTGLLNRVVSKLFGGGASGKSKASDSQGGTSSGSAGSSQPPAGQRSQKSQRRKSKTLDLDASQFLPISRDDLMKEAQGTNVWASPFFGRRDLIPPADDKRTNLIDRALVAHGLLSPEDLAEIHDVGAEMDKHRPDQMVIRHQANLAGHQAIEAERAERARIKKQKKEEAAQRREQRRAEIAHRKATDIIFLGRGVSDELHNRNSDLQLLSQNELPALSTPADVARVLELEVPRLRWLAFHTSVASRPHYVYFDIPKSSGGVRTLSAPHRQLAAAQRWVLENVLSRLKVEDAAHGFVARRSTLTNARPHVGKEVVINMDLEGFFPSIGFPRVKGLFKRIGYSPAVATILALLCTETPRRKVTYAGETYFVATGPLGLPQGACTSPMLSNVISRRLDRRISGLARKLDLTYTRYADDITVSGGSQLHDRAGYVMACVRHIAQDEGFAVNNKKTRVLRRSAAQAVTGLVVNDRPSVNRKHIKRIRAILHRAKFEGLEAQNRENHPNFVGWLTGHIAYIAMSRPEVGSKLKQQLDALLSR